MNRKPNILAAFLAAALSVSLLCGCNGGKDSSSDTQQAVTQGAEAVNSNIEIPGYESVEFKAGKKKQSSRFYNPEGNNCFFRLSLVIGDETLWKSDYIAPGEKADKLKLNRALDAGEYAAKLKYECFTLNDKTPLNGAEIELKINVR